MKVNSTTFLCTLPHFPQSPPDDDTTSLTHAEEEKERLRARKKGWELLRPLEGNCMFYVLSQQRSRTETNSRTPAGGPTHSVTTAT